MNLTNKQKKFIKNRKDKMSVETISRALNVSVQLIREYLVELNSNDLNSQIKKKDNYSTNYSSIIEKKKPEYIKKYIYYLIILFLLVIISYGGVLNHSFVSDDVSNILNNKEINNISYIWHNPLLIVTSIIYYFVNLFFGKNYVLFHALNILFHIGVTLIIFYLILRLSEPRLALITSFSFSVHPILVEAVTWISGGPYVRYSFFFLCSLLFYIKSKKNFSYFWWSIIFFILSLFSSDKAIVTPLLFLLYEFALGRVEDIREVSEVGGIRAIRENWKKLIVFFGIAGIWVLFYLSQIGNRIAGLETASYSKPQMLNPFYQIPIALTSYIQLIFWPDKLTLYHSEMFFTPFEYLIRLFGVLGMLGVLGWTWKKNRQIFFWLSFFIISLLPTLTPFGISWIVAERYVYLGTVGILFIAGYLFRSLIKNENTKVIGYLLFIIWIIGLTTRTIVRNMDWKNEDTLWTSMITTSPSDPKTHNNLGDMYGRHGDLKRAEEEFKKAIELNPNYGDAYHNLGNVYLRANKFDLALQSYKKAANINPLLWQSYQNIAAIYYQQKKYQEALGYMEKAVKINSQDDNLLLNLGIIYLQLKKNDQAKLVIQKALEINPQNEKAKEIIKSSKL